jgi:predicted permease
MLRDMDEEVRAHLALRVDHLRSLGMTESEAEAEAMRRFGDTDEFRAYTERRVSRYARWHRVIDWFGEWAQDVRFANRQFNRNVGFTALAVLTLALGIGANTAIFTVVHRLLITPLPYPDGNRIVKLVVGEGENLGAPPRALRAAWRDRAHSLEMIAAVSVDGVALQDVGQLQDSVHAFVTSNYLKLLGLRPALGRAFTEDEERPGAPPVVMISYGRWQRGFGGRADVLGSTIRVSELGDRQYTIVGVTPPEMSIPMSQGKGVGGKLRQAEPALWLPASVDSIGGDHVFAKLRPGISARQASGELQSILESMPRSQGNGLRPRATRARAMRAQDFLDPREAQTVQVLFVAVGVLLLIACANVANLLMSRAWTRRREFAVRTALGAGRARLARQVLTESVLLALAGGLLGVGVAWLTLRIIIALRPPSLEHLAGVSLETTVLLWSAGISVMTGILFGSAPALFAGARSPGDVLRNETRSASGGPAARRMRSTLIVLEIAMSLVLLAGAGLLVRSFVARQQIPLGFKPHGLVSVDMLLMLRRDWTLEHRASRRDELVQRLRAMPGVTEASIGMMPGLGWHEMAGMETDPDASGTTRSISEFAELFINPNYFRVTGMSLIEGRLPDSTAQPRATQEIGPPQPSAAPQEIVVNRALAQRLWPNGGAVGARLHESRNPSAEFAPPGIAARPPQYYTVVGVVEDVRLPGGRNATWTMEIYQPLPQVLAGTFPVVLRTVLPEREAVASIRRVVTDFDRTLRAETRLPFGALVQSLTVGDRYISESLAPTRFAMALLAAFSVIALLLSGVGLYGVIAYSVTQRTREIGVRVALGADARSVRRLVVGGGLKLTTLGIVLGIIAAAASTRVLASLLYGVSPVDPVSFGAIALLVMGIAVAASYVPARRAMRIDPTEALRAD